MKRKNPCGFLISILRVLETISARDGSPVGLLSLSVSNSMCEYANRPVDNMDYCNSNCRLASNIVSKDNERTQIAIWKDLGTL